jgi:hypothetical protein
MSKAQLRSIYSRARRLDFSPSPWVGIKDLLALVAVTAGFKPIAAFGFLSENNEGEIRNLRDRVVDLGLKTQIATFIQKPGARHLDGFPAEVVRAFQIFDGEKVGLEGAGRRMRIQMKGIGVAELVRLSRMVWSDKS